MLKLLFLTIIRFKKFIKFAIVGVFNAILDLTTLIILVEIFKISIIPASIFSFIIAVTNSYLLNKYWTFRDNSNQHIKQFSLFILISTIGLALNTVLIWSLLKTGIWYVPAKMLVIIVIAFWNFLANNYWTFNKQPENLAIE